jgi:hypothetical protein
MVLEGIMLRLLREGDVNFKERLAGWVALFDVSNVRRARILDATDMLVEADSEGCLSIWYSDITSVFFRTIVEFFDDDILVDDLRSHHDGRRDCGEVTTLSDKRFEHQRHQKRC